VSFYARETVNDLSERGFTVDMGMIRFRMQMFGFWGDRVAGWEGIGCHQFGGQDRGQKRASLF
jgi:hypothetical protein